MKTEHEIVNRVYGSKMDAQAADALVREYFPYIQSETARFLKRMPIAGQDDELNVAMFAFHEAAMAYVQKKGSFLKFAAVVIRNRLIDYRRKEKRHTGMISLDQRMGDEGKSRTLLEKIDAGHDEIAHRHARNAAKEEILEFSRQLSQYGLRLTDVADNCPKQARTMKACHQVLAYARKERILLDQFVASGKLPLSALAEGAGVEKKTLERHRKYLVALLLAYTNGYEIIRGHLSQITSGKGA